MKKQLDYAEKRNYQNILFIESDKTIRIKNAKTREEKKFKTTDELGLTLV